jgi:ABC-2 type transport system permease protein
MSAIWAIVRKDLRAYYLKPPLISWAIIMPIVLVLAFYLRHPEGIGDLLPGLVAMTVLFGATSMEGIVFTFEKRIGALERLLLAPVSLRQVLMGKVLGGTLFGAATGIAMLLIGMLGFGVSGPRWEIALPVIVLSSFALSCMAMALVAGVREVFEAMTLFNYFRFPMVFLCGVFVPVAAMALPLRVVAYVLPLTYVVDGLGGAFPARSGLFSPGLDLLILGGYSAVFLLCAELVLKRSVRREG